MYRVHPKHHQHIFSPLTMLYNYVNQTKQSINQFLNQYLKPQGRLILKKFNRYMILIVILNIDIKFLLCLILIAFICVKIIKLKPWDKNKNNHQLPISYISKLHQIQKQHHHLHLKRYKSQDKESKNTKQINISQSNKNHQNSQESNLPNLTNIKKQHSSNQKQSMTFQTNDTDLRSAIITNIQPRSIQHQIYDFIKKTIKMYCKFIWFVKAKSIIFMWAILIIIYFFQPNLQNDAYHIVTSTDDGVLQIQSIQKASQYVNYFHLIFLWIIINLILFYQNGTKQLKTQLLQQLYTKQYTYNLIKQKKFKANRLYSRADQSLMQTHNFHLQDPLSQKKYNTFILKKKQPIDLQQLKNFSNSKPNHHHDDSEFINLRKFSHDDLAPNSPLSNRQTKKSRQKINIEFVESQEQFSQKIQKRQNPVSNQQQKYQNQKNQLVNEVNSGKNTISSSKLAIHQSTQKKKILQRKNSFLPIYSVNNENILQRKRKTSQQMKNKQKQNDFKINLFKVEDCQPNKNKQKNMKKI